MKLTTLFDQAVDLDTASRGAFIVELAGRDAAMAAALTRLLDAEKAPILAEPNLHALRSIATELSVAAPKAVGGFQLIRPLGRGGMGEVWLATRSAGAAVQEVALKILRFDIGNEHARLRFQLEQKMIATMNHPFIARMIDANHGDGDLPWIAMEYVDGVNLTQWCTNHQLPVRARVALVIKVLEAVAHAHQHLVVHRDLKSSNVMVTREGVPKLLDFGIAKSTGDTQKTATAQRFFSVGSVAPEQYTGERTTVATDIYQMGILLYELLTGAPAYDLEGLAPAQIQECILHRAPEIPSRAVSPSHAKACGLDKHTQLQRLLAGELDRIVMYALRKNPAERYATAAEFARDLQAYLDGRPVLAAGQSKSYQARKFLTRHWLPSSLAALAVIAMLALTLQLLLRDSALNAAREAALVARDAATKERDKAQNLNTFLLDLFRAASPTAINKKDLSGIVLDAIDLQITRSEFIDDPSAAFALIKAALGLGELAQAQRFLAVLDQHRARYSADDNRQLLLLQANLANIEADFPRLKAINAQLAKTIHNATAQQKLIFIGYVGQTLVDTDPKRVLAFTDVKPLPASLIRLRARAFTSLKNYPSSIEMLVAASVRKDLTAMEHLSVLQSLALAYLANKEDAKGLLVTADLIKSAGTNLGEENLRALPFWNTRALALVRSHQDKEAIAVYDELLRWRSLSENVRFTITMNRLLAGTNQIAIDSLSRKLAHDVWRGRESLTPTSVAYAKIALLRVLSSERKLNEARALAASPDLFEQLEEPTITELRAWRGALSDPPQAFASGESWLTQLARVNSRDSHLHALLIKNRPTAIATK